MSLHRLSAGAGLRYLLRDTASADVARPASTGLSEYYATSGNPPGRWYGAGLAGLSGGDGIQVGSVVSEAALAAVFGGSDPHTGQVLGLGGAGSGSVARAVAGFDLTFTVPKSVSVMWALGDRHVQAAVESAHHAALGDVLSVIQARALFTRTGHGGVHRLATHGAVAAGFDHWDSRAHDPNLHTHLVIANRVQGVDGTWRAIDARDLHAGAVAFSELYDTALADHLHHELGVSSAWRDRGSRRAPAFEVDGIGEDLIDLFSTRAATIDAAAADPLTAFEATHRRQPDRVETIRLRQQATLATRPVKTHRPLEALRADWAERARLHEQITNGPVPFPRTTRADLNAMGSSDVSGDLSDALAGPSPAELARAVVAGVAERRSTWTTWNLTAEAIRILKTTRCPGLRSRLAAIDELVTAAQAQCVALHDAETAGTAPGRVRWTSPAVLDAEAHLVNATADRSAPTAPVQRDDPAGLSGDQIAALVMASGSGRRLDVLLGPAGSGKTALLRALADVWRRAHGTTSVIGLAPSAAAAANLAGSLGIPCENTAKWLHESRSRPATTVDRPLATGWTMRAGQLVIVDEASLASTTTLVALLDQARDAGAKLLLVGDHHQLPAVESGGAFGLLARKTPALELVGLWRFRHRWEAHATRDLRHGDPAALDAYAQHHRLHDGTHDAMLEAAYQAWCRDRAVGLDALLLAADNATVTALNGRARADRILAGQVDSGGVTLQDGTTAGTSDLIVTRLNARQLTDRTGRHVRNGDTWHVVHAAPWGDLYLTPAPGTGRTEHSATGRADGHHTRASFAEWSRRPDLIVLPADYVAEHVQLGYAATVHRAQGTTSDTCHVVTGPGMAREHLYVALTRGRTANHVYVSTDTSADLEPHQVGQASRATGRDVLHRILATSSAELSATEHRDLHTDAGPETPWHSPALDYPSPTVAPPDRPDLGL